MKTDSDLIEISRDSIEKTQDKSMFNTGPEIVKIKIYEEKTGRYCYFIVSGKITKSGRPAIETVAIGDVNEQNVKVTNGKWRKP